MRLLALLTAIGLSAATANVSLAQPKGKGPPSPGPGGAPDVRKLQAELDKLQEAIKDVESQLKKARTAPKEEERRGPSGFGPPGGFGRGFGGFGPWGSFGRGPGGPGFTPPMSRSSGPSSSVEKRLDKIEKDIAELKQMMMRGAPRR